MGVAERNLFEEVLNTRKLFSEQLKKELLGPGSEPLCVDDERELIQSRPDKRYCIGILYPQQAVIGVENDETVGDSEEEDEDENVQDVDAGWNRSSQEEKESYFDAEDNLDEEISMSTQNKPSSMGITFLMNKKCDNLRIKINFATYRKAKLSDCIIRMPEEIAIPSKFGTIFELDKEKGTVALKEQITLRQIMDAYQSDEIDDISFKAYACKLANLLKLGYVREPQSFDYEICFENREYYDGANCLGETVAKITALRHQIRDGIYSYTIMLVNTARQSSGISNDVLMQPEISVSSDENGALFLDYSKIAEIIDFDSEEAALALEYRNKKSYASGLGVAVDWNIDKDGNGTIHSTFYPSYEVPSMDFDIDEKYSVDKSTFSMKSLSDLNREEEKSVHINRLSKFIGAYQTWIGELEKISQELESQYTFQAKKHIDNCKTALARMENGIKHLEDDEFAWEAFQLANRAMFMQRVHIMMQTAYSEKYPTVYADNEDLETWFDNLNYYDSEDNSFWRPFQLAFILLNIVSMCDDQSTNKERDIVDLIWFPTGGGKTEAYLGLTAFTIFYRRLKYNDDCDGTTVIMRYTLRLLTAQQFTRASTLICACEMIREDCNQKKGKYPKHRVFGNKISIGLWIGAEHTPNTLEDASKNLKELSNVTAGSLNDRKASYNKFQVLKCPWCGTKMTKDLVAGKIKGDWGYKMGKGGKRFYLNCPNENCDFNHELPIQIVDQELYSNPPTLLFATVDKFAMLPWKGEIGAFFGYNTNNRAPELIIQDELHLISGPLGTMVGIYESAIDYMCQHKGAKAKIIASTATICRAKEQCSALYDREVFQFPSPGLDEDDSFFARAADITRKPGRLYVGLMPSGKTKAMMETRIMAATIQLVNNLDVSDECKDNFWTLAAYFNSLKELGKCSSIVDDDVKDYIRRFARRTPNGPSARMISRADELTSRKSTTELNETLDKLEKIHYSADNIEKKVYASSVLLASNMISVGIDVSRLNLMLMVGQPKLTSEYIQASSRVGRKYPGIVMMQYDASRSRDRSHYEQFKQYHGSFYKFVEPTCVTPFSEPARDRALHAIAIALIRHSLNLEDEGDISKFELEEYEEGLKEISGFIENRIASINARLPYDVDSDIQDVEDELQNVYEKIDILAKQANHENLVYGLSLMMKQPEENQVRLMKTYDTKEKNDLVFDTLTSLRSVADSINGSILVLGDKEDE